MAAFENMFKGPGYKVALAFIVCMIFYFVYIMRRDDKITQEIRQVYPAIEPATRFNGMITMIVNSMSGFRNDPLTAYITVEDTDQYFISTGFELSGGFDLEEVLKVGSYIVKDSGSYFVEIYSFNEKDTVKYNFELTGDGGYPLRKGEN